MTLGLDLEGVCVYFKANYRVSNRIPVGLTRGFARHHGRYPDPHGVRKERFVRPLRAEAYARLANPEDRDEWACRTVPVRYARADLRSLRD